MTVSEPAISRKKFFYQKYFILNATVQKVLLVLILRLGIRYFKTIRQ